MAIITMAVLGILYAKRKLNGISPCCHQRPTHETVPLVPIGRDCSGNRNSISPAIDTLRSNLHYRAANALYTTSNTALEHRAAYGGPKVQTSVPGVLQLRLQHSGTVWRARSVIRQT